MQVSMRLCLRTGLALGLGAVAVAQAFAADIKVGFITSLSGPVRRQRRAETCMTFLFGLVVSGWIGGSTR